MTQIIATNNGGGKGGGGGEGDMLKSVYDPQNIGKDAFDYDNFTNTPTIPVVPTEVSAFDNDAGYITSSDLPDLSGYQLKSNLVTNLTSPDDTHYPSAKAVSDAITSAGGGDMLKATYDPNNIGKDAFDYDNFINTPTIPAAQIQSDWNEADNTKADYIKNKPTIPAAQVNSDWNANSGVAQILNKPTIPTVNNPTITIQKNGTKVEDFTLNQSSGETINITVPTKVSDLSNDSGFITGITSGDVTTALGYTPYNSSNPDGYISGITSGDVTTALGYTPVNPSSLGTAASKDTGTSSGNVPVLDSNGKLNTSTLPGVALTDTFTVTNKSDLTSLSSAEQGDIGIVTSESKTYVLSQAPYSTLSNWKELLSPTDAVTSVNGQTGAVTLDADDISDSTTTNKFVTATEKSTWSGKQDALSTQTAYTSKGSATKVPQITTNTLGQVTGITEVTITHPSQVDDTAFAASWDGVTTTAPSKNAVYDKINAMDTTISNKANTSDINTKTFTITGTSDYTNAEYATQWYLDGKTPIIAYKASSYHEPEYFYIRNVDIVSQAGGDLYGLLFISPTDKYDNPGQYRQLVIGATVVGGGSSVASIDGITVTTENYYTAGTNIAISGGTISATDTTYESKAAASGGTALSLVTTGEKYTWNNKANATDIGNATITFTQGGVSKGTITTNQSSAETIALDAGFNPGGTATTGYVVTKTANGYEWKEPTGGISLDSNSPITVSKLRVGTEAQYSALGSYDASTIYMTV